MLKRREILKPGEIIPLTLDPIFKSFMGTEEIVIMFLSRYLNIPEKELKNNITFLNEEKRIKNKNEKDQIRDLIIQIGLNNETKINLEMNVADCKSKGNINRNLGYISEIYSRCLETKENYANLDKCLQINFNTFFVDEKNKKPIDKYYLMNKEGNILTNILQSHQINILECKEICYNNNINKYETDVQEIIKWGALLSITKEEELKKLMEVMEMGRNEKKKIINKVNQLSENDLMLGLYSKSKHEAAMKKTFEIETRERALKEGMEQGIEQGIKQGIEKGIKQGIEKGVEQERKVLIQKMLESKIPESTILSIANISKKELLKIKEDI